jgi:hypothetical protein
VIDRNAWFGLSALLVIGCGSSDETQNSSSGSSSASSSSSTTSSSSSSSTTSSSSSSSGGAGGVKQGLVAVTSGAGVQGNAHGHTAQAVFVSAADGSLGVSTVKDVGPCKVTTYTTPPVAGKGMPMSAGDVDVMGGAMALKLTADAMNNYAPIDDKTTDLFTGGEMLSVHAAGGDVPAFSFMTVAPSALDLTAPPRPANQAPLMLDRASDLALTWDSAGMGSVIVAFSDSSPTLVQCTFAAKDKAGTIPKDALAALAKGAAGTFFFGPGSSDVVAAGDYQVQVVVANSASWGGSPNTTSFTYQATN